MPLTQIDPALLAPIAQYTGFKNRIINGAMMIDQRNAGASVTANDSVFIVDRWKMEVTQSGKLTGQQNAGSVTPPNGFKNYLGLTSSSAYSVGAGDYFCLDHIIEGYNISDLGWGTANAQSITISFWVRSSLTGTFGATLANNASNRSYPFTYTISAANTWEQKSVTIAGDTSGTWVTDNGVGLRIRFGLGAGATYSGTPGSWAGSVYVAATGATSVVGTNGATFYITGVQLEKGSTATSFDYRPYGTELALCQRYYEKSYDQSVVAGTISDNGCVWNYVGIATVGNMGTTAQFKVDKRTQPTMVWYSPTTGTSGVVGTAGTDATANTNYNGQHSAAVWATVNNANGQVRAHFTATAEL